MFIFISGAVRSGKSEWAERAAVSLSPAGRRIYLATAQVYDEEMRRRVVRHVEARRTRGFETVERERDVDGIVHLIPSGSVVLLECLGTLVANEMFAGELVEPTASVIKKVMRALSALRKRAESLIIVSNDIFSDGLTYDSSTENYRTALGALHTVLAPEADCAVECICGLAMMHSGSFTF